MSTTNQEDLLLPITIYTPESALKEPFKLLRNVLRELWLSRSLAWTIFCRDINAEHRQSLLGFLWMFIPILVTTFIWTFLSSLRVIKVEEPPVPYALHVIIGVVIWNLFTSCVSQPLTSFQNSQGIFMKLKVPPEAFVFAGMLKILADTAIRLLIIVPVFVYFQLVPPLSALLFPLALLGTAVAGMAIGVLIIPLGSLYSDVTRLINTALPLGFYVTPIIFPIPESGFAAQLVKLNPCTSLIQVPRDLLTIGPEGFIASFLIIVFLSVLCLLAGFLILRAVLPVLVERMGM